MKKAYFAHSLMHRVKRTYQTAALLLVFLGLKQCVSAQGYFFYDNGYYEPSWVIDAGINVGFMNCITDIGGSKRGVGSIGATTLRQSQLATGITLTATHKDWLAVRLDLGTGRVAAADSLLAGATQFSAVGRFERNLSFRSPVSDVFVGVELHPLFLRDYQISDRYMPRLSPYITAGFGFMTFNPQANIDDRWVNLRPLRLEGQGFAEYPDRRPYGNTALIFPLGVGLRYELSRIITLRMEVIRRTTTTDYLDDVSKGDWVDPALFFNYLPQGQAELASRLYNRSVLINPPRNTRPRGDDRDRDMYWSAQFRFSFALNRDRNSGGIYKSKSLKCAF